MLDRNPSFHDHNFFHNLENIKKDYALELMDDELSKDEEQLIQEELENLVSGLLLPLDQVILRSDNYEARTFGQEWIDALTQEKETRYINSS